MIAKIQANIAEAKELLKEAKRLIMDSVVVSNDYLPENYKTKRKGQTLTEISKKISKEKTRKDPRAISVKFVDDQIYATPERLAAINRYREMAETGQPLTDDQESDLLYVKQLEFAAMLVELGALTSEDFEEDE